MAGLQKQYPNFNFAQGLDTKTDPFQVEAGRMLGLENSIFTKLGLLQKRNGFGPLSALSDTTALTLSTYRGSLVALGSSLRSLSQDTNQWGVKGSIPTVNLSVTSIFRNSENQDAVDLAVASNQLVCSVYRSGGTDYYYQVSDSETGQVIVPKTAIAAGARMARVFSMGQYFVITYLVTATNNLNYIRIPINSPATAGVGATISSLAKDSAAGYDAYLANGSLYFAFNGSDGGGAVRLQYLTATFTVSTAVVIAGKKGDFITVTADQTGSTPVIWATYWDTSTNNAFSSAYNQNLIQILGATQVITTKVITEITSVARSGTLKIFYQVTNSYSSPGSARSDYVQSNTCTVAGSVGSAADVMRSVGLASKAFYVSATSKNYFLATYGASTSASYEPSYFLIDESSNIVAKLAYSNAAGYAANQILPQANVTGTQVNIGYLIKDLVQPINRQNQSTIRGLYNQTGVNMATFLVNENPSIPNEIGEALHLTGGYLSMYDGSTLVEHGFHVWPEDVAASTSATGGSIAAGTYYYVATYEWTDAQGLVHRSAPSIPISQVTTGSTSTNTIQVPTLRLTAKLNPNKVRIVLYRSSVAQTTYYQISNLTAPTLNDTTADAVTFTDTALDNTIIGNLILYTTGGVVENIAAPACSTAALFKSRLVLINAEDENEEWYSKQVVKGTPVEMSDLFTTYAAPTQGAQGSTGGTKVLAPLDDKLIYFKKDAIYYQTGNGPDNTGANNDFETPTFVTGTTGCDNQQSVVLVPSGLMFQSPTKGIWLLGRDLSTSYIGAAVEDFNSYRVLSAINIPNTNQVRFTLSNGVTLMYDYFFNQWGTFTNIPAISSTVYQELHTFLNVLGQVFQETDEQYLDGSRPVLMKFTTAWIHMAGLQGFQRAYMVQLLGRFISPHKLNVEVAYDYAEFPIQSNIITPTNYSPAYGGAPLYGSGSPYGGSGSVMSWDVMFQRQKCQAIQLRVTEIYDPSYGVAAGAGLTLSNLNFEIGAKFGARTTKAANVVG